MRVVFKHVNIISQDWEKLAQFYQDVFGCVPVPPERDLKGEWLDKGLGLTNAHFRGIHLQLPGCEEHAPTLEIFEYDKNEPRSETSPNREGIMHLAFEVEDVSVVLDLLLKHGGSKVGEITESEVSGAGVITFIYAADPEGNIVELQSWE